MIDPRAIVSPDARIADDVAIGPFAVIGPGVQIGAGTWIGPHAVVNGPTTLGRARNGADVGQIAGRAAAQRLGAQIPG